MRRDRYIREIFVKELKMLQDNELKAEAKCRSVESSKNHGRRVEICVYV